MLLVLFSEHFLLFCSVGENCSALAIDSVHDLEVVLVLEFVLPLLLLMLLLQDTLTLLLVVLYKGFTFFSKLFLSGDSCLFSLASALFLLPALLFSTLAPLSFLLGTLSFIALTLLNTADSCLFFSDLPFESLCIFSLVLHWL